MTVVSLGEYRVSEERLPYELAERAVAASGGALSLALPDAHGVKLAAAQHVGVVRADGIEVRIEPKVPVANVLAMLASATGLTKWLSGMATIGTQDDLLRSTVAVFARTAADLLASGPQKAYVTHEERLVAPRGRLHLERVARHGGIPSPMDCSFDELTADTLLNRYVLAAVHRALRVPDIDAEVVKLLRHVRATLAAVRAIELPGSAIDRHVFTRLDERYRPTIAIARLVLDRLSLHLSPGGTTTQTFTVDMNRLFEKWVEVSLPGHLPAGLSVAKQTKRWLGEGNMQLMRPDLEIQAGSRTVYVADTKYKLARSGYGRVADYYQALAYATVLKLDEALLIYCDDDGETPTRELRVVGSRVKLTTHAVNVRGTALEIDAELRRLGTAIAERCRPAPPQGRLAKRAGISW